MKLLKQSTASTVLVGPVLDANGAAVTTAVVGDFGIAKNGTTATLSGATVTHVANGYYTVALTTGNTDTVGRLVLYSINTAQLMATHHWTVLLASVFDALQTNATNSTGGLATATATISAFAGAISTLTASGVRTELTTELGRIDAAISSRMATYTQPTGFLAATFPTTVSSYAGGAVASVTAAVTVGTNNDKTGYSLSSSQTFSTTGSVGSVTGAVGSVTGAVGSVTGAVGSVTARVTANTDQWNGVTVTGMPMPTYTQPTGFLAATFPATVSSYAGGAVASVTGNVGGNVVGSVGSILGVTFPAHFNDLQISANGHVSAVVESIANNSITASSIQGGAITAAKFATDAITAAAIAADAVTEIQNGLATLSNQTAIKTTTDRLATMLVADGAVYQYTANALELAPGGGGGSGDASQTTLLEVQGTVEAIAASLSGTSVTVTSQISQGGEITLYCGDDYKVRSSTQLDVTITDVGGAIYSRLNGIGVANLSFGAARPVQPAGAISGTVASLSQAGSGASQTITIAVEIEDGGAALRPADDYVWQIVSSEQQGSEYDTQTEIEGTLVLRRRVAVPVYG